MFPDKRNVLQEQSLSLLSVLSLLSWRSFSFAPRRQAQGALVESQSRTLPYTFVGASRDNKQ